MPRLRIRNVYRSEFNENLVQELVTEKKIFSTIRELLCFSAMLGYALQRRKKLPDGKKNDVSYQQFEANDAVDNIYLIAVCETQSTDCLRPESEVDMVTIFEEYAHGGLETIQSWYSKYSTQDPQKALISGLYDEKFIDNEQISKDEIREAIKF